MKETVVNRKDLSNQALLYGSLKIVHKILLHYIYFLTGDEKGKMLQKLYYFDLHFNEKGT